MQAQTRHQMGGIYYAYPGGPSAQTGTFGTDSCCVLDSLKGALPDSQKHALKDSLIPSSGLIPAGFTPFISVITVATVPDGWRMTTVMYGYAGISRMRVILLRSDCR